WQEIARAQVIVHLHDARTPGDRLDADMTARLPADAPVLDVLNKLDLLDPAQRARLPDDALAISAHTGEGLEALQTKLLEIAGWKSGVESPWLARERHVRALEAACEHLLAA